MTWRIGAPTNTRGSGTTFDAESRGPSLRIDYIDEPELCFADGNRHIDPKLGLMCYGPKSYSPYKRHPASVRVGFIGSAETINATRKWIENCVEGVDGDANHLCFPGYQDDRGFYSELSFDDDWIAQLHQTEISDITKTKSQRSRIELGLCLLDRKLRFLADKDQRPEYIIICLPGELERRCRVANYHDPTLGEVHRDLRRAFKSLAMKYHIPTQLIRAKTLESDSAMDHPSVIAWNFFTGLYFKAGGFPWGPVGLTPGTCYVGISFYRPMGSTTSTMQTSLIQAFDEHGDGLVLRGHNFEWDSDNEGSRSPHLTEDQAHETIGMVLARYEKEMGQRPRRMVVHKSSRYWPAERSGFESALGRAVEQYDLVAMSSQSMMRLLAENQYPPLRGTRFRVGDLDYLYTTGYVAELKQYTSGHVPSPIQIADHVGHDTSRDTLLKEILILTKMNWNSSKLGGSHPITLRFSRLVGDVMREIPQDRDPLPNYKYYM